MDNKRIRYINRIFTIDKINQSIELTIWDKEDITNFLNEYDKHYGLKLINSKEEIFIKIEYSNIIWQYRIYLGSYKRKYLFLTTNDERWQTIEKFIDSDLKMIGLENLKNDILLSLKNNEYYEYKIKKDEQFKKYCVKL